ncbi:hypothetical protein DIPPA_01685 [Diplonema papillatum]|nr:hypothetical protein DIPPA_01685 [Diplonema papillatum]
MGLLEGYTSSESERQSPEPKRRKKVRKPPPRDTAAAPPAIMPRQVLLEGADKAAVYCGVFADAEGLRTIRARVLENGALLETLGLAGGPVPMVECPHVTVKYWGDRAACAEDETPDTFRGREGAPCEVAAVEALSVPLLKLIFLRVAQDGRAFDNRTPHMTVACGPRSSPNDASVILRNLSEDGQTAVFYGKEHRVRRHPLTVRITGVFRIVYET